MALLKPLQHVWMEAEIENLAGESSDFDRKSGRLMDDESHLKKTLAKAISAFANSGGGHILLGVDDDGTFSGIPQYPKGRQTAREWMELIASTLTDYPVRSFNVQEMIPAQSESKVPEGRCVLVIGIGDSELAPHQSIFDHVYYWRQGGHSVPARHRYLDLLRHRPSQAVLAIQGIRVDILGAALQPMAVNDFKITVIAGNLSRTLTANLSRLVVSVEGTPLDKTAKAVGERKTSPILPGCDAEFSTNLPLGIQKAIRIPDSEIWKPKLREIVRHLTLTVRVASDSFAGIEESHRLDAIPTFIDGERWAATGST